MKRLTRTGSLIATALLCFSAAWAQQQPKNSEAGGPVAPIQPLSPLTDAGSSDPSTPSQLTTTHAGALSGASGQVQPDTHVLSSAENLGVGSVHAFRRIFDPALRVSEFDDTGFVPGETTLVSNLGGSLDVQQHWGAYHLTISYSGLESYYQPPNNGMHYLPYHSLTIAPEIFWGRWILRLRDSGEYSWGAGFGSLFAEGPAQSAQTGILNAIQPSLAPEGTIQTGLA